MIQLPEKHQRLIQRLTSKTLEGDLEWEQTGAEDFFVLHLSTGAVVVGKEYVSDLDRSNSNSAYRFEIYDQEDEAIRQIDSVNVGPDERQMLQSLFEAAKSSFFESDETVDVMLRELEE